MKVLVFLELGADVRIPPERDPRSGHVREEWLVREIDPASARALDLALSLKAVQPGIEVVAVHLGPAVSEVWLRQALARGCDRAMRVWDQEVAGVHTAGKAMVLAAAAQALGFELVLTGAAGVLDSSGQVGVLMAGRLGVPCVTQVLDATLAVDAAPHEGVPTTAGAGPGRRPGKVELTRGLDRGYQERVEARLPVVATLVATTPGTGSPAPPDVSAAALLAAQAREIPVWDLADLGVPLAGVRSAEQAMQYGRPRPVRPRLHPLAVPDSSLPAFDRILRLVEGSVQRREGRVVRKPAEEIVEEVFQTLRAEGWLDHLRAGDRS
jgi:electron transfer flavoprotein beta subunit